MSDTFTYSRSTVIQARAEHIVPLIEDFHQWARWSPWEKLDADLKKSFSGPEKGVGASYAWEGKKSGTGNMTLSESSNSKLTIALNFLKPFQQSNVAEFAFAAEGEGTRVTWSMTGKKNFMSKVMGLFMDMDKMIGKDFERGLADLKAQVESR